MGDPSGSPISACAGELSTHPPATNGPWSVGAAARNIEHMLRLRPSALSVVALLVVSLGLQTSQAPAQIAGLGTSNSYAVRPSLAGAVVKRIPDSAAHPEAAPPAAPTGNSQSRLSPGLSFKSLSREVTYSWRDGFERASLHRLQGDSRASTQSAVFHFSGRRGPLGRTLAAVHREGTELNANANANALTAPTPEQSFWISVLSWLASW